MVSCNVLPCTSCNSKPYKIVRYDPLCYRVYSPQNGWFFGSPGSASSFGLFVGRKAAPLTKGGGGGLKLKAEALSVRREGVESQQVLFSKVGWD